MRCGCLRGALRCALFSSTLCHWVYALPPVEPGGEAPVSPGAAARGEPWVEVSSRELSLSLGARVERGDTRSGVLGFAALRVPLDRFVSAPNALPVAGRLADAPPAEAPAAKASAGTPATATAAVATPPAAATPTPLLAAPELSRLARETVAAALRANGAALRHDELDRVASRARASAALPELRVRGQRSDDESLRLTPSTEDPYRYSVAGGRDWLLEAQLTFRLSRLVFADEELPVERLRIERERASARTAAHVLERVLDWHRSLSLLSDAELAPEAAQKLALDALGAEVELDVLTGGWFGARAARYREPATGTPDSPQASPASAPEKQREPAR